MRSPALIVSITLASSIVQIGCATSGSPAAVRTETAGPSSYGYSQARGGQAFPEWVERPENVYPAGRYMNGIGTGRSEEMAKRAALANLASVFKTKIQSVLIIYESESSSQQGSSLYSATRQTIRATTDKELQGAWIAETWSGNGVFYAVALLDRQKAAATIAAEIQGIDAFLTDAFQILEGKKPLVVRKSDVRMSMAAPDPAPKAGEAAKAAPAPQAAPTPAPTVEPAQVIPQGRFADTVAHAEEAFEALDSITDDAPAGNAASTSDSQMPAESPQNNTTAAEQQAEAPKVQENAQLSAAAETAASSSPSSAEGVAAVRPEFDAVEFIPPQTGVSDDIYLARSTRLQKAWLAQKIAKSSMRRSQLNADLRIISSNGAAIAPPAFLGKLEAWAEAALRDLRVAVRLTNGSGQTDSSGTASALVSSAADALSGLGVQLSQGDETPDLIIEILYTPEPSALADGWFWRSGAVQLSLVDSASSAVIGSVRKSGKKAAQIETEAQNRLIKLLSAEVKSFLQSTLVSGL